jgi:hypothetical protein
MIGSLQWAIELGCVGTLLEEPIMSKHLLPMPCEGYLEQVLHIMGYIKQHKKLRLVVLDCGYPKVDERWCQEYDDWYDFYHDAKETATVG